MKRFWLGAGLLAALLALSLYTAFAMEQTHQPISSTLEQAAEAATKEDWLQARSLYTAARASWEQHRRSTASVADHTPMEEIDSIFAQLEIFLEERELPHFVSLCRELGVLTAAVGEAHGLSWWNIL